MSDDSCLFKVSECISPPVCIDSLFSRSQGALDVAGSVSPLFASKLTNTVFN